MTPLIYSNNHSYFSSGPLSPGVLANEFQTYLRSPSHPPNHRQNLSERVVLVSGFNDKTPVSLLNSLPVEFRPIPGSTSTLFLRSPSLTLFPCLRLLLLAPCLSVSSSCPLLSQITKPRYFPEGPRESPEDSPSAVGLAFYNAAQGRSPVAVAAKARSGQTPQVVSVVAVAAGYPGHQPNLVPTHQQRRKPRKLAVGTRPSFSR